MLRSAGPGLADVVNLKKWPALWVHAWNANRERELDPKLPQHMVSGRSSAEVTLSAPREAVGRMGSIGAQGIK
jgi:hypothetical protein